MKNKSIYHETHPLPLNVFLVFYEYVFVILVIANILPVFKLMYFIFLIFGIIGICILLVKYRYHILIKKNVMVLSITIPFKVSLLKIKVKGIKTIEETTIDSVPDNTCGIKKLMPGHTNYVFNKGHGIKLTTHNEKIFIISCANASSIIARINELKV